MSQPSNKVSTSATEPFETLIDSGRAAALLSCHPKTLQKYARQGKIPRYLVMGQWQFRASELDDWLRSQVKSDRHPCRMNREKP